MTAQLTVHNAEIKTATVEVRTLTISGKQVTLAVFRQLPQRPLPVDVDHGQLWGTVNYCPDKTCGVSILSSLGIWKPTNVDHLHVVWQDGTELYRHVVYNPDAVTGIARQTYKPRLPVDPSDAWSAVRELPQLFIAV